MHYSSLPVIYLLASVATKASGMLNVTTTNGTVEGGNCSSTSSNYFLGIPYADPPVRELRYQPPQPFSGSYNGTLDGTQPAPICLQWGVSGIQPGVQSEDCLYLNVYAPADATPESKLPVRFWIHGGAFVTGGSTSPMYDGCFSSDDEIVVTINYRLGPLGYLALENTTLTGNYGLLDQLQAIRWVHDNIAAFGGDSEHILLFGQSAGAMSSFILATMPEVGSYINAVIMESGGGFDFPTVSEAYADQAGLVTALNCTPTDVDCIRSIDPAVMNATYIQRLTNADKVSFAFTFWDRSGAEFAWGPVVESSILPVQPSSVGVQVPAIFGSNGLEGSIFVLQTFGKAGLTNLTAQEYAFFLESNFGPFALNVSQAYPLSKFENSVFEAISIVTRDYAFRCTAHRGANRASAKGVPVWTYSFNQTLSCPWAQGLPSSVLPYVGAAHAAEIPFVFGEVSGLPPGGGNCNFSEGEKSISAYMQASWTHMAGSALPGPEWASYSPNSSLGVNFENGKVSFGLVDYSMCAFWDGFEPAFFEADALRANNITTGNASATASAVPVATNAAAATGMSLLYALIMVVSIISVL